MGGGVFDIKNSRDFLEKLYQDYADFDNNRQSTRLAINSALTAYHLAEWVWGEPKDPRTIAVLVDVESQAVAPARPCAPISAAPDR
jgi:hypothetical protein